jgi:hypothetical protein
MDSASDSTTAPSAPEKRICGACGALVVPMGKGKCPECKRFMAGHTYGLKHPVSQERRAALFEELVAEYQPADLLARASCRNLAAVMERLESTTPGSPAWGRLMTSLREQGAALREARSETPAATVEAQPTYALERLQVLLDRMERGETLSEREEGALDVLLGAVEGRHTLLPDPVPEIPAELLPTPCPEPARSESPEPADTDSPVPATDPRRCPYCLQTPCVGPEHPAFDVLHMSDPVVIEKRRKEATAVMLAMLPYGRRGL